jgi:hypothetical protein
MMSNKIAQLAKWCSIPMLLIASMFSYFAASYEPLIAGVVCLGAIILIQRAVWSKQYHWGGSLVAIVVVFSPLLLTAKIFLLMGIVCVGSFVAFLRALRPQTVGAL